MLRSLTSRFIALGAFLAGAILLLVALLASSAQQTQQSFAWVSHTNEVKSALSDVMAHLSDAESGQRGFLLTHNAVFSKSYQASTAAARNDSRKLVALVAENPSQLARARALQEAIRRRITSLDQNLERGNSGLFEVAADSVATGNGHRLMEAVRAIAEEIRNEENALLARRRTEIERRADNSAMVLWLGGPIIVLLIAGTTIITIRSVGRPIRKIQTALESIDLSHRIDRLDEMDMSEFHRLAQGFNRMADRLEEHASGRQEASRRLEAMYADLAETAEASASRGHAIERLAGMAHRMQAARTDEEMAMVIACFVPQVLPHTSGALYAFNNSRNQLVAIAGWGGLDDFPASFAPDDCWGLRRGQDHSVSSEGEDLHCGHVPAGELPYHCHPLLAGGQVIGLLYLACSVTEDSAFMLDALCENIASALVNQRLQRGLREQTIRDPLTGLFNRRYMEETLSNEIARAARGTQELCLVMCDVDHFKRANDEFGHSAGDLVLQNVAAEIARHFRDGDVVCRFGGEEFAIIVPGASVTTVCARVERLREAIARLPVRDGTRSLGSVTMSFGIAQWQDDMGTETLGLLEQADAALYRAKGEGRNRVVTVAPLAA